MTPGWFVGRVAGSQTYSEVRKVDFRWIVLSRDPQVLSYFWWQSVTLIFEVCKFSNNHFFFIGSTVNVIFDVNEVVRFYFILVRWNITRYFCAGCFLRISRSGNGQSSLNWFSWGKGNVITLRKSTRFVFSMYQTHWYPVKQNPRRKRSTTRVILSYSW